eukprot:TRINITY_DN10221_c0_g2_i1.p1 TRINITY_DN10221_c0_g2~~TRINITY_DN10221_c0_g2_i1.p1  ORF type:complete len:291 (-),score=51.78 TRINITY_DN10221_c0_g2_i1:13-885(-)
MCIRDRVSTQSTGGNKAIIMKNQALLFACFVLTVAGYGSITPWMCLERCGGTSESIKANLKEIELHKNVLTGVAYEAYNLGPNSTLIVNDLTSVVDSITSYGLNAYAMISSYPYPPQFLDWMREVFRNPAPFFAQALKEIEAKNFQGYNVDWEPTKAGTLEDAKAYVQFLDTFARLLHTKKKTLSVDIGGWNPIWNWRMLGKSSIDRIYQMSTYTGDYATFKKELDKSVTDIPLSKLSVGLMTVDDENHNQPFTQAEIQERFSQLADKNIKNIGIWKSPIPSSWWPFLEQ